MFKYILSFHLASFIIAPLGFNKNAITSGEIFVELQGMILEIKK